MSKNKQATLFQSWGNKKKEPDINVSSTASPTAPKPSTSTAQGDEVIDLCDSFNDEDDGLLFEAEESVHMDITSCDAAATIHEELDNDPTEHTGNISVGADGFTATQGQTQTENLPGFDKSAGQLWIYPTNYPVRDYQFNIVQQALFKNTMVTLPTGLGKTFIAAVVMYNFYRWYPQGKVIFMAPTKPLVAQQIEACYNIMGIPQQHTAEMTGSMNPPKREKAWHEKRVFFLTPQVLTNDLSRGSCPAQAVCCLVIDEAHKSLGNHAYCQVVRELVKYTENFRVLSLSATPGSDIKAVQQVLTNLLISHIEIRTEESIDIRPYTHERKVDKVVVPLGDELSKVKDKYIHIMEVVVGRLKKVGVLYNRDTTSLSKFLILKSREAFRQNPPEQLPRSQYGVVEGDFAMAMSLYHGYELLQLHGSRSLYNFLDGIMSGEKSYGRTRTELGRNGDFNELIEMLSHKYRDTPSQVGTTDNPKAFITGHPKMEKLQEIVLQHFTTFLDNNSATRVMIFSQYRNSVQEIRDMLEGHAPLVKVMSFIGQASAGKGTKGFTQKEQLMVMSKFRDGGYNTLVSTCVGEEGLDIGDVDLIICFDAHKSPIRLVQRMGRTGRKREGRIVMLVTQGKEEQIYNQSQYSKKSIHKAILNGAKSLHFYQHSPRMVPEGLNPAPHKMHLTLKESFKPTKKLNDKPATNQKKIVTMLDEKNKKGESDEIITLEEYRELYDWLVPEEDIPKLPTSHFTCLSGHDQEQQSECPTAGVFLSLSDWSPWQTTLQATDKVDHSMGTRHLVELMEFIQLQQSLDPEDDPYGEEMAAYLNDEDILNPGQPDVTEGSILKFCTKTSGTGDTSRVGKGKKKLLNTKVRRSDSLPNFGFLDDNQDKSSDDDLPAFNFGKHKENVNDNNQNKAGKNTEKDVMEINLIENKILEEREGKEDDELVENDLQDAVDGDMSVVDHGHEVMDISDDETDVGDIVRKSGGREGGNTKEKKLIPSKAKEMEMKINQSKDRKRKKKRNTSGLSRTIVDVITDINDSNDFDDVVPIHINDNDVVTDKNANLNSVKTDSSNKKAEKQTIARFFPGTCGLQEKEETIVERVYMIRTPPPVEEAVRLCEDIDTEMDTVKLDLVKLIDEWHSENEHGKYLILPKEHKFDNGLDKDKDGNKRLSNGQRKMSVPLSGVKMNTNFLDSNRHTVIDIYDEPVKNQEKASSTMSSLDVDIKNIEPSMMEVDNNSNKLTEKEPECAESAVSPIFKSKSNDNAVSLNIQDENSGNLNKQGTITFKSNICIEELSNQDISFENISVEGNKAHDKSEISRQNGKYDEMDIMNSGTFEIGGNLFESDKSSDDELINISFKCPDKSHDTSKESNIEKTNDFNNSKNELTQHESDLSNSDEKTEIEIKETNIGTKVSPSPNQYDQENVSFEQKIIIKEKLLSLSTKKASQMQSSNNKLVHDSWLADDTDDELFVDVATPVKPVDVNTSTQFTFTQALACIHSGSMDTVDSSVASGHGSESINSHCSEDEKTSPIITVKSCGITNNRKTVTEDLPKGHSTSKYINSDQETSPILEKQEVTTTNMNAAISKNIIDQKVSTKNKSFEFEVAVENMDDLSEDDLFSSDFTAPLTSEIVKDSTLTDKSLNSNRATVDNNDKISDCNKDKTVRRKSSSSDEVIELPEFDLGFDFDDDIIPPSPQMSQKSTSSRLSQTFTSILSQGRYFGENKNQNSATIGNKLEKIEDDTKDMHDLETENKSASKITEPKSKRSLNLPKLLGLNNKKNSNVRTVKQVCETESNKNKNTIEPTEREKVHLEPIIESELSFSLLDNEGDFNLTFDSSKETKNEENITNQTDSEDDTVENRLENTCIKSVSLQEKNEETEKSMFQVPTPVAKVSPMNLSKNDDNCRKKYIEKENVDKVKKETANITPLFKKRNSSVKGRKSLFVESDLSPDDFENGNVANKDCNRPDQFERTKLNPSLKQKTIKGRKSVFTMDDLSPDFETKTLSHKDNNVVNHSVMKENINNEDSTKGRKSLFVIDDLSPDCFEDSFDFNVADIKNISKVAATTPNDANKWLSGKSNTSTPIVPIFTHSRKIQTVTPLQNDARTPLNKLPQETHITPEQDVTFGQTANTDNDDDSFIVRKKKKSLIIDSPESEREHSETNTSEELKASSSDSLNANDTSIDDKKTTGIKTINKKQNKTVNFLSSSDNDDFDDSFLLHKNKYISKNTKVTIETDSSDDDFEESVLQPKPTKGKHMKHNNYEAESKISKPVNKKKRSSNPFIEDEAELSDEDADKASDDEDEHDLDQYEGSFIADSQFSQSSQVANQTDMHALYLKSVRSPLAGRGGYKLQYDYKHTDVFSQMPQPDDSEYMEDSFCVVSEEDDWLGDGDVHDDPREVTLLHHDATLLQTGKKRRRGVMKLETGRQREIHFGRMRALDKIKSKAANKNINKTEKRRLRQSSSEEDTTKGNLPKRSRIQKLDDSSSEEEITTVLNVSNFTSPNVVPQGNVGRKKGRLLLSSSDDDDLDTFVESRNMCISSNAAQNRKSILVNEKHHKNLKENNQGSNKSNLSMINEQKTVEEIKEERLKKQRMLQEQFKKQRLEKKSNESILDATCGNKITLANNETLANNTEYRKEQNHSLVSHNEGPSLFSSTTIDRSRITGKPNLLVDAKEISGSQDIISDLRFKHNMHVSAAQLPGCDYVISNRMAVERKQWSEFSNGANRAKLIERMQHLGELYDRPCLIVEKDRVKTGDEKSARPVHWTKYVDRTFALLLRSSIKVLFTDTQAETASLLADLCQLEQRKGMGINAKLELSEDKQNTVKFYVSLPKLSYIHALNLCEGFKSVSEFLKSSIPTLERLGKMSTNRATDMFNFIRRNFDSNMLPTKHK